MARWKAANRDKIRGYKRKRGKMKRHRVIRALLKPQRGRCAYCRGRLVVDELHIDHITARSKGGSNALRNLQLTCSECNIRKGVKAPEIFAREMGRLL